MLSESLINKNETSLLYMIEFFIHRLNINLNIIEKVQSDYLSIHIKFLDFPALVINNDEFLTSAAGTKNNFGIFIFNIGKSLVFSKRCKEFFDFIKNRPIKLMLIEWITNQDTSFVESDTDDFLIGETVINLSEYLCDQIFMKENNQKQSLNLYEFRNIFQLSDKNNGVSGTIDIFIRISCFGQYLVTQFHTNNDKLVFKNSNSKKVFECLKLMNEKEKMLEKYKEKICLPDNYYKRKNQDLKSKIIQGLPLICENSVKLEGKSSFTKYVTCNTMEKEKYSVDDKNREVFENNIRERMRGGGVNKELEKLSVSPISSTKISIKDFCKPNYEENQPGCGCHGKSEATTMKSGLGCMNTPCTDIDCLIQKLKEAQEFVNSLGKVPGMQGLGLMDPAESPYFNRNYHNLDTTCTKKQFSLSNEQKQSNLAVKTQKKFHDIEKIYNFLDDQEYTVKFNEKLLSTPVKKLRKDEKIEKKDDESVPLKTNEVKYGPCGKVTCISRKVNFEDDFLQFPELSSTPKLSLKNIKKTKLQKNKSKSSKKHSKAVSKSQSLDLRPNYVHISKKIMKLVNSTRPRFYYGHKSCVDVRMRVPGNMGWLWNTRETVGKLKPQVGWKPGAISRNAWNSLEDAKIERTSEDIRDRPSTPVRGKRAKGTKRKHLFFPSRHYWGHRARDDEHQLPPTLHIHRKTGNYYVTFYPINKELINKPEEQQTIKPLHFHIRKNKNSDFSDDSSSTASDMEIEFSPPAATTRYQKKVDTRDVDTLVYQNDIIESVKEILPEIQSKKKKKNKKIK